MILTKYLSRTREPYKSRPEREIANLLDQYSIPFIYEKPTAVVDSGKTKLWFPDYTLSYGVLIEYFGINGSQGYRDRTKHKLKVYDQNQFQVIDLYPKDMSGGWQDSFLRRIDSTLEGRLNDYRGRTAGVHTGRPTYSTSRGY